MLQKVVSSKKNKGNMEDRQQKHQTVGVLIVTSLTNQFDHDL